MATATRETRARQASIVAALLIDNHGLCPPDDYTAPSRRKKRHTVCSAIRVAVTGRELSALADTPQQSETVADAIRLFSQMAGVPAADFGDRSGEDSDRAQELLRQVAA